MTSKVQFSGKDYGGEGTRTSVYFPTITGANYDTQVQNMDDLLDAINAVVSGAFTGYSLKAVNVPVGAKASSDDAQRERKWLVSYTDDTNPVGNGSFEIGMANSAHLASDSENMDVSGGVGAALVTEIEDNCVSRLGNAITVQSIKLVGRST